MYNPLLWKKFELEFYNKLNETNLSLIEYEKMKSEEKEKEDKRIYGLKQTILSKVTKWEVLTPEEYEFKIKWEMEVKQPFELERAREWKSTVYNRSSTDLWMWFIWWAIFWSLIN